jgi:alcohol dehydrogenase class IV
MDALSHAMESYLAKGRTSVFSRAEGGMAIELIVNNFVNIALKGKDYQKECAGTRCLPARLRASA